MSAPPVAGNASRPPRRARLARYGLWQLRDYALERGLPTVVITALFTFPGALAVRTLIRNHADGTQPVPPSAIVRHGSVAAAQHAQVHHMSLVFLRTVIGAIIFLAALLAMQGLASNDRKNGYFRLLFAKPVTPERYYGQAFLVHWAGVVAAFTLLLLLWGWLMQPIISVNLLATLALMYLCYAGIAFALTAAMKWDWIAFVGLTLVATLLWTKYGDSTHPLAKLLWLLPPLTKTDSVYDAALATRAVAMPWGTLAWLAGYGVACYVAGLVILHHRRLAIP